MGSGCARRGGYLQTATRCHGDYSEQWPKIDQKILADGERIAEN